MSVYNIDGQILGVAYNISGASLSEAYSTSGLNIFTNERKPIKTYDYASDPDPDKEYQWQYNLTTLQNMQDNCFTIGIQTDTHFVLDSAPPYYNNYDPPQTPHGTAYVTQLKNMTKRLYFDFITNMGDVPHGWGTDYETPSITEEANEEMMRRYTDYVESPVLIARGNHDPGMYQHGSGHPQTLASVVPKATLYDELIGGIKDTTTIVEGTGSDFYYYKDFDECRVIVLDTNDYPYLAVSEYDIHGNHHTLSASQVEWFAETALNTTKPVIVISHCPLVIEVRGSSTVVPAEDKAYDSMVPYRADEIMDALYEFIGDGGEVVACLSGHIHAQNSAVVNGINHIVFGDGGAFAEIVFIDFETKTITTKIVGTKQNNQHQSQDWQDRTFAF